jgi:hypothetical protein
MATTTRRRLQATPSTRGLTEIHVLDNPLAVQDPALARAAEATLREVLEAEDLGPIEVRFRVCRELDEGMRFICKVENPPLPDVAPRSPLQLRWWSPLMETAQDFRAALTEAMENRRQRMDTALPLR